MFVHPEVAGPGNHASNRPPDGRPFLLLACWNTTTPEALVAVAKGVGGLAQPSRTGRRATYNHRACGVGARRSCRRQRLRKPGLGSGVSARSTAQAGSAARARWRGRTRAQPTTMPRTSRGGLSCRLRGWNTTTSGALVVVAVGVAGPPLAGRRGRRATYNHRDCGVGARWSDHRSRQRKPGLGSGASAHSTAQAGSAAQAR